MTTVQDDDIITAEFSRAEFDKFVEQETKKNNTSFIVARTEYSSATGKRPRSMNLEFTKVLQCSRNGKVPTNQITQEKRIVKSKKLGQNACPCKIVVRKCKESDKLHIRYTCRHSHELGAKNIICNRPPVKVFGRIHCQGI